MPPMDRRPAVRPPARPPRSDATEERIPRTGIRADALQAFAARLDKNARHWGKWARRRGRGAWRVYDRDLPEFAGQPVDLKLVALAKHLKGKLITNDYNLNKVARLHDVEVVNLNDVANALKPTFLPGEQITVRVVKPGEEPGQGIGYLDDGTMVVVEGGGRHIEGELDVTVTRILQTVAGRMIFAEMAGSS